VGVQHAELAFFRIQQERDVVRIEPTLAVRDQRAERVLRDQVVEHLGARLVEMGGDVHGNSGGDGLRL
jgi:hypothetical protein